MNRLAVIYDNIFLKHETGNHPENPARLLALIQALKRSKISSNIDWFKPEQIKETELALVHTEEMIEFVKNSCDSGGSWLDPYTCTSPGTYEAALFAAGAGKTALNLIYAHNYKVVFIPARPQGHHATSSRSMGFCVFNNEAICAKLALAHKLAKKIAVIDWDIHHGNGIEEVFYQNNNVLYMSTHQMPYFPGTGFEDDTGHGKGKNYNLNAPLPAGAGNKEYLKVFQERFAPAIHRFSPDLFIIAAGFDGHAQDPLSGHTLNSDGYQKIAAIIAELARKSPADGKIICFLEGGYNPAALSSSAIGVLEELLGNNEPEDESSGFLM